MNGNDLLTDFRRQRSESAFAELVRRYTNLVFTVARRRLSNDSLAQEVTQSVFLRLARSAPELNGEAALLAWLHRTTVHVSIDTWRTESRRRAREQEAAAMRIDAHENAAWENLAPVLDEVLDELPKTDRQTLLLRFFDRKSMRELGEVLGVSEDAAKMRVSRALDRLRDHLKGHGVTCGAIVLGSLLVDRAVEAAPQAVVASLASAPFPIDPSLAGSTGTWTHLTRAIRAKLVPGLVLTGLVGTMFLMSTRPPDRSGPTLSEVAASDSTRAPVAAQAGHPAPADIEPDPAVRGNPDPLALLQRVARARGSIDSGTMELRLTSDRFFNEHRETGELRLSVRFDGEKFLWEQVGREYRYTAIIPDSDAQEARIKNERLDRATAIRERLLEPFDARYVTAYDGSTFLTYSEVDGKSSGTVIADPKGGSSHYVFDPRYLGLGASLWYGGTVEDALGYVDAKSIQLVGQERLETGPAWHVRVLSKYDVTLDFWIDAQRSTRVLKQSAGREVVVSKYDGEGGGSVIPSEVTITESREGSAPLMKRFVRTAARFNQPIDPATFTLAGLGMSTGTIVTDVRNHRIIGYWNGSSLSEERPRKDSPPPPAPTLAEMRSMLDLDPTSASGLEAALWILRHTPDGPDVEKAAEVVMREHVQNTELAALCRELERLRPRSATNLLAAILRDNPDPDIQVTACFSLATLLQDVAEFGRNKAAAEEAARLFQRVIQDYGAKSRLGAELARKAEPELYELRHLGLGQPAPPTRGVDLEGQPLDLGSYRGRVVVLFFWSTPISSSDVPEFYRLQEKYPEKSLAILGVCCDDNMARVQAAVEKGVVRWPSFDDRRSGPIAKAWNVKSWPTRIVIDAQGRIQYHSGHERDIEKAVDKLLGGTPR